MESVPSVSVLIATLGEAGGLRECLERVAEQAHALGGELVVVFNAEPDAVARIASECELHADAIVYEPRPGKSHALNTGICACRGEVIAFTDDDTEPADDWLRQLVEPLLDTDAPPRLAGSGGPIEPVLPNDAPAWYRRLLDARTTHFLGPKHSLPPGTTEWSVLSKLAAPAGANCAYRRSVFDKLSYAPDLGPNRQTGLRGGEDTLLGVQVLEAGYEVAYRPRALVRHRVEPARMTWPFVSRGFYLQGVERTRLMRALGRDLPSVWQIRYRIAKKTVMRALTLLDSEARTRRDLQRRTYLGVLDELTGRFRSESD